MLTALLTPAQRHYLRGLAHKLKPVVQMGQKGLTPALIAEINYCLQDHELIKLKLNAPDAVSRAAQVEAICQQTHAEPVQQIGRMVALYRKNQQQEKIVWPRPLVLK